MKGRRKRKGSSLDVSHFAFKIREKLGNPVQPNQIFSSDVRNIEA